MKLRTNRAGFTLVEMLVATALIMFIMLILSEAFVAGLEAFRTLKGIGDMESRLKAAVTPIREDFRQDHFDGRRRLSDPLFWNTPVREGFVKVTQGFDPTYSPPGVAAGSNAISLFTSATATWTIQPSLQGNPNTFTGTVLLVDPGPNEERMLVVGPWPPPPGNNNWVVINLNPNVPPGTGFVNAHPANSTVRILRQWEGQDADSLVVSRATDHILHLAVKLRGNRQENFFTSHIPGAVTSPPAPPPLLSPFFAMLPTGNPNPNYAPTTFFDQAVDARFQDPVPTSYLTGYKTQWAEIAYFLWPNGTSAGGTPLYALYRAEFKVVPDNRYINGQINALPAQPAPAPGLAPISSVPIQFNAWNLDGYAEMSAGVTTLGTTAVYQFYNPSDLAGNPTAVPPVTPSRVFSNFYNSGLAAAWRGNPATGQPFDPTAPERWSATLIATDVVSFDVQILSPQSGVADFSDIPTGVFDTFSSTNSYTINAIKITLRVWDLKTRQTRQVSIIQDM
jgi:hypothetical protein